LLDGVSRALPATLEGFQLTRKASRIGFDWEDAGGVFEKMREETEELKRALKEQKQLKVEEELGDLLFAAVNLSRFLKIDPEIALKKANAKSRADSAPWRGWPGRMAGSSKTLRANRWRHSGTPRRSRKGSRACQR